MEKQKKIAWDWGIGAPLAPSVMRRRPVAWLGASLLAGAVVWMLSLALLWTPLPLLADPPWSMERQLGCWLTALIHLKFEWFFRSHALGCSFGWEKLGAAGRLGVEQRCGASLLLALLPSAWLWRKHMTPRDELVHMRGAMRHEGDEAVAALNAKLSGEFERAPDHEIAPGVGYPATMWTRHALIVGGTGSGKSTFLKPLISAVVKAGEPMILFDPKGEFTSGFAEPAIIAPWDSRSLAWDIARDMRNIGDIRRFADGLIEKSTDPMWASAAKQLLTGLVLYLKRSRGDEWGWSELASVVMLPLPSILAIMKRHHEEAIRAVEKASVTSQGILINLSAFCGGIFDLALAWGDVPADKRVSFVDWTLGRSKFKQIILQGHMSYEPLTRAYARGIVEVIAALVGSIEMEDDPKRKLWLICDEAPLLGAVPIRNLYSVGRSRGFRCLMACQDLAQLEEVHGEKMVKSLVSMSGTLLVGQITQGDTAEQLARAIGTREVERLNVSTSTGAGGGAAPSSSFSFARDDIALYKPSELGSRLGLHPDGKGVVFSLVVGGHAYELYFPHFQMRKLRPRHVPAPWTLGVGEATPDLSPDSPPAPGSEAG